jgi:hypothetical protein
MPCRCDDIDDHNEEPEKLINFHLKKAANLIKCDDLLHGHEQLKWFAEWELAFNHHLFGCDYKK